MDYNARYYSSYLGRFISADTVVPESENPQHWNRYSYGYNNPLRYTDPTGHCGEVFAADVDGGHLYDPCDDPGGIGGGGGQGTLKGSGVGESLKTAGSAEFTGSGGAAAESTGTGGAAGSSAAESGVNAGAAEGLDAARTSSDLYATGNLDGPRVPRIEGNLKPGQTTIDIYVDKSGNVIPGRGGASTFEQIEQLPTNGHVWRLPAASEIPGFTDVPDGAPLGPRAEGHHSLVPNTPMTPAECISCFQSLPWKPVMKPDGLQLKLK